jgi:hypothetical protein
VVLQSGGVVILIIAPRHYVPGPSLSGDEQAWIDIVDIDDAYGRKRWLRVGVESVDRNLSVGRAMPWPFERRVPDPPDYTRILHDAVSDFHMALRAGKSDDDEKNPISVRAVHRLFGKDIPAPEPMLDLEGLS